MATATHVHVIEQQQLRSVVGGVSAGWSAWCCVNRANHSDQEFEHKLPCCMTTTFYC